MFVTSYKCYHTFRYEDDFYYTCWFLKTFSYLKIKHNNAKKNCTHCTRKQKRTKKNPPLINNHTNIKKTTKITHTNPINIKIIKNKTN